MPLAPLANQPFMDPGATQPLAEEVRFFVFTSAFMIYCKCQANANKQLVQVIFGDFSFKLSN